jgi:2-succinyl-5-enolpyruvyl-6-hydroxy-3-cyclohexene-1-carboxylate synthase
VIVAGRAPHALGAAAKLAAACGYPLLADPLSGARRGGAAIAHYDLLLRHEPFTQTHRPEVVIRLGDLPTPKPLRSWLASLDDARQIAIDPQGAWQDPAGVLDVSLCADPGALGPPEAAPADWLSAWRASDAAAAAVLDATLSGELSELAVARLLGDWLAPNATLFVAASMPVREIETTWAARDDPPRVLANRGANGIDGSISSAFGIAATTGPAFALIGDVAFTHDIGGLLAAKRLGLALTIVLLDNGGGGIFDFLPVASEHDVYEQHVATPTTLDFERAAALYDLDYARPTTLDELRGALEHSTRGQPQASSTLIHIRCERAANLALHRRLWTAVADLAR